MRDSVSGAGKGDNFGGHTALELCRCGSAYVSGERRARDLDPFRQQAHLLLEQVKTAVDEHKRIFHSVTIIRM